MVLATEKAPLRNTREDEPSSDVETRRAFAEGTIAPTTKREAYKRKTISSLGSVD